jgi:hypothetical protein
MVVRLAGALRSAIRRCNAGEALANQLSIINHGERNFYGHGKTVDMKEEFGTRIRTMNPNGVEHEWPKAPRFWS